MRRLFDIFCVVCLCLSVGCAALWFHSRRRGGSLHYVRGGAALAAYWAPGELSAWFGRVDGRCTVNGALDVRDARHAASAPAWFEQDKAATSLSRGRLGYARLGYARCSNFPNFMPNRFLRGPVTGLVAPMWLLVAAAAAPPLARAGALLRRRIRTRARWRRGRCVRCGYDLRASGESCPECGHEQAHAEPPPGRTRSARPFAATCAAALALVAVVVAAVHESPVPAPTAPTGATGQSPSWWLGRAVAHAGRIQRATDRFDAYRAILRGYSTVDDPAGAATVLGRLEAELTSIAGDSLPDALPAELACGYARLGADEPFWRHALPAERAIDDDAWRLSPTLAAAYAARDDFPSVADLANRQAKPKDRISFIDDVSKVVLEPDLRAFLNGVSPFLRGEADRASYWGDRSYPLFYLAQMQIRVGDVAAAEQTAESIPGLGYRANLLDDIADAYAAAANDAAAHQASVRAAATRPGPSRFHNIRAVDDMDAARKAHRRGEREAAEQRLRTAAEAIEQIADPAERDSKLVYLAEAYAETGQLDRCRTVLERVGRFPLSGSDDRKLPRLTRQTAQPSLVGAIAAAGDLQWAVRIAEMAGDDHSAHQSWVFITRPLIERGDLEAVEAIVREKLCDPAVDERSAWGRFLAREQVKRRGSDSLQKWIDSLPTPREKAWAMIGVAEAVGGRTFH